MATAACRRCSCGNTGSIQSRPTSGHVDVVMASDARHESLEAQALLDAARAAGVELTRGQLEHWTREGLLPKPIVRSLGRGRGKRSEYPASALEQLCAAAEGVARRRSFEDVKFELWFEGWPIEERFVRRFLEAVAADLDETVMKIRELADGAPAEGFAELSAMAEAVATETVPPGPLRRARKRVGPSALSSVMRVVLEMGSGSFEGTYEDLATGEDEGLLVERAMGLERARSDSLEDIGPWLTGDPEETLHEVSGVMTVPIGDQLAASDWEEMLQAREEMSRIMAVMVGVGSLMEEAHGPDAFGFPEMARTIEEAATKDVARIFLMWLRLRKLPQLQEGILEWVQLFDEFQNTGESAPPSTHRPEP